MEKIPIKNIPIDGLFLYKKRVWRSLGLDPAVRVVTAQRVLGNKEGLEVCMENADFTEHLMVEPYEGKVPANRYTHSCGMSHW